MINDQRKKIHVGSRVVVSFRNKLRQGIVLSVSEEKPNFQTQEISEILDEIFIRPEWVAIAREVAEENFTSLERVLNLLIPEKFFTHRHPEEREIFYTFSSNALELELAKLRGEKQKKAIDLLRASEKISASTLLASVPRATIHGLLKKGILCESAGKIKNPFPARNGRPSFHLTERQSVALDLIRASARPVLLWGVTGSGKTEIYKKLAQEVVGFESEKGDSNPSQSGQVLILVPEISLTPQLISEFHSVFGDQLSVWHSKLSEGERVQEWARIQSGEAKILIGARSAVFVPLQNPKLIILDEEHEWTFKSEFSPRFWTHDIVQKISKSFGAKLIFGTATPRLESFYACESGEWERVNLDQRVHEVLLPEIQLVDLRNETKKGNFGPLSEFLVSELQQIIEQKKQAIFFLNKRGFSGATLCRVCGHTFQCPNCAANMKLHSKLLDSNPGNSGFESQNAKFICHICGHLENFSPKCPQCGSENFQFRGWGTQQVEKILQERFPGLRIFRADADSVPGKNDFEELMNRFHNYEADVLLGTQMIAKGLDFERVELVGVILADVGLSLPDVRAEERVFQILTQVSGRAGRRMARGKIVVQTFRPDEKLFDFVKHHDSDGFLRWQAELRQKSNMPPFSSLAKITFSHAQKEVAFAETKKFFNNLRGLTPLLGEEKKEWECHWAPAFFPRTHGKYHFHVFLHAPQRSDLFSILKKFPIPIMAKIDIDPASLL